MNEATRKRPIWLQALGLLFVAHLLFCVQRLELKALPGRLAEVRAYHEHGAVAFHTGDHGVATVTSRSVQFLLDHTAPDCVILRRGHSRGLIEHAAALLAPRLLYDERQVSRDQASVHGRPIARGEHPDLGAGVFVLVADGTHTLRLELR